MRMTRQLTKIQQANRPKWIRQPKRLRPRQVPQRQPKRQQRQPGLPLKQQQQRPRTGNHCVRLCVEMAKEDRCAIAIFRRFFENFDFFVWNLEMGSVAVFTDA